jgi:hypothetical protein
MLAVELELVGSSESPGGVTPASHPAHKATAEKTSEQYFRMIEELSRRGLGNERCDQLDHNKRGVDAVTSE